jgi:hypothetical protein
LFKSIEKLKKQQYRLFSEFKHRNTYLALSVSCQLTVAKTAAKKTSQCDLIRLNFNRPVAAALFITVRCSRDEL